MSKNPRVLNIIRYISKQNYTDPNASVFSVNDVNEYLSKFVDTGYKLVSTHYLGETPEGFGVLYILMLEA